MKKLQVINECFSCAPGTKYELTNPTMCVAKSGTLYVMAEGATGVAEGSSNVFAMINGAVAQQASASAKVQALVPGAKASLLPVEKPPAGVSRTAGCARASDLSAQLGNRPRY